MIRNVDNKEIVVNDFGSVYCYRCKSFFRSGRWAFEHKAPVQCNSCKRLDYWKKELKRKR